MLIAYRRVSTCKQDLGIDAQDRAISQHSPIVAVYTEVESGRNSDRPQLKLALAHARRVKATLIVAKLDRLARNVKFLLTLLDGGVDFIFCDLPHVPPGPVGRFILTQMAAVAELEAGLIAGRTREALAVFKAQKRIPRSKVGTEGAEAYAGKLGSARPGAPQLTEEQRAMGRAVTAAKRRAATQEAYGFLIPLIHQRRAEGLSYRAIAREFDGVAPRSRPWDVTQILRLEASPSRRLLPQR
jgi:DNA invertase Pin-like site-specific DNA recombinase